MPINALNPTPYPVCTAPTPFALDNRMCGMHPDFAQDLEQLRNAITSAIRNAKDRKGAPMTCKERIAQEIRNGADWGINLEDMCHTSYRIVDGERMKVVDCRFINPGYETSGRSGAERPDSWFMSAFRSASNFVEKVRFLGTGREWPDRNLQGGTRP